MTVGVLCSGKLGLVSLEYLYISQSVVFVCTDSKSTEIITFCKLNNIKTFIGNPREGRVISFIKDIHIDILISVNYLFIIDSVLIGLPKVIAFNIHGSLLPKYRGRTPHVWSIINNESSTGITAHVIDEGCDTGDIILQREIPIGGNDTGAIILEKYENEYVPIIKEVLNLIASGSIKLTKQDPSQATYFGKRNPEDGRIDWNWQKERIRNWIRAQAYPYPGAFSTVDGSKVIIDRIDFTNFGYAADDPNGLIKSIDPVLIKTPNGVIELTEVRIGKEFLNKGKILK